MTLRILVAMALPRRQEVVALEVQDGATVADALREAHAIEFFGAGIENLRVGVWGAACALDAPLRDGDRVEVYRPLQADPKEMRRRRAGLRTSKRARSGP